MRTKRKDIDYRDRDSLRAFDKITDCIKSSDTLNHFQACRRLLDRFRKMFILDGKTTWRDGKGKVVTLPLHLEYLLTIYLSKKIKELHK